MVRQTMLPLKIEKSQEGAFHRGGLALLGEFILGTGLPESVDRHLPKPGSGAGYRPSEYIFPMILMLHAGGRSLEDLRIIRDDKGLREILPLARIPTPEATGDWLRRMGTSGGLDGLEAVQRDLLRQGMENDATGEYILNMDALGIEAEKGSAAITYKGFRGYLPILGHLADNGFVVADDFRQGNVAPSAGNLEFLKKCMKQMPKGKRIKNILAGSASYQPGVINFCREKDVGFVVGVDPDKRVLQAIQNIKKGGWKAYGTGYISHTTPNIRKTGMALRLIVFRRPYQKPLFGEEEAALKYRVIATNRRESDRYITDWYDQQGNAGMERINDLKVDFGLDRMPCGQFEANALFFRIGVVAYNCFRLFILKSLDPAWHRLRVGTVFRRFYQIAGKSVFML